MYIATFGAIKLEHDENCNSFGPVLIKRTDRIHQGQGHGNGSWEEEEHWVELYDNCNGTYTRKIVRQKSIHTVNEENITIHKTKEVMTEKEYFKLVLKGAV